MKSDTANIISTLINKTLAVPACLALAACNSGGGGSLSVTENSAPGINAFEVSAIADIDLSVDGAEVNEDDPAGAMVGLTAFASDEDLTNNDVRYSLTDDSDGRFAIDSLTGVVTLAKAVSAAEGNQRISVTASSIDGSSASARFLIRVRPSDRFDVTTPTDSDAATNRVELNASPGTAVGITASAEDMDVSGNAVSYTLSDDAGARFAIDSDTGIVTVARSLAADTASAYTIEVTAMSEDGSTSATSFTIAAVAGAKPIIAVDFPTRFSVSDSLAITLRGSVRFAASAGVGAFTAAVGSASPAAITVNSDNSWSHQASLAANTRNKIDLVLSDDTVNPAVEGNSSTLSLFVSHYSDDEAPDSAAMTQARGLALDRASNRVYVVADDNANNNDNDSDFVGLYVVDLQTGVNSIFSYTDADTSDGDDSVGGGAATFSDRLEGGIVIDSANSRLLVSDYGNNSIVAVSLAAGTLGDRSVLSGPSNTGPALTTPFGMALDAANSRVFVADTTVDGIIAVSLSDGNRSLITGDDDGTAVGTGPTLASPRDVAYDSANSRLLLIGTRPDELIAVDLSNGNRSVIEAPEGNTVEFDSSRALALDSGNGLVYVAERAGDEGIISVAVGGATTGARAIVSNAGTGTGPAFAGARGVALDSANNRLLVVDDTIDSLVAVDLATGNRALIEPQSAAPALGTGPALISPTGLVYDQSANRLYLADDGTDTILAVSLNDGNRTVVSDSGSPGDRPTAARGLAWNFDMSALLVPDNAQNIEDRVISIDPQTGAGTVVASAAVGMALNAAPTFGSPRGHIAAVSATSVLVADTARDTIFQIDPGSGDRRALATASDAELEGAQSVIFDSANNRALVATGSATNNDVLDAVVSVAVGDGAISVLSSLARSAGSGDEFSDVRALALDSANDRLLALDTGLNALVSVDLSAGNIGNRAVLSDSSAGNGDLLSAIGGASGIALDSDRGAVYVVSESLPSVVMIDLASGDQVIISR